MSFCNLYFPVFILLVTFFYWIFGKKIRKYYLLLISLGLYCFYDWRFALLLIGMTLFSFAAGKYLEHNRSKIIVGTVLILHFLPLCVFKTLLFPGICKENWSIVLPLGMSYYTFKVIGYLTDIYRGKEHAENRFCEYALFVSFFPEIFVGPIDRADNLLRQIDKKPVFDFVRIKFGVLLLCWGYFQKVVVADRIAIYVNAVYADLENYTGFIILTAILLYSMQIYMDFSGCTNIVRGMGFMLGYRLPENFCQPYMAKSVAEFWSHWHMSLTNWFRDYLYIPLGGNRKGKIRKYLNILLVFLVSGIWHGNGLTFAIWGILNGIYQIIGDLTKSIKSKLYSMLHCRVDTKGFHFMQGACTYILISIAWVFFRAKDIPEALLVFERLFYEWHGWELLSDSLYQFVFDMKSWHLMLGTIGIVWIVDLWERAHKDSIFSRVLQYSYAVQLLVAYLLIFGTVIFGAYGAGFNANDFIYLNF